jgi:hypothetical protein
MYAFGVGSVVDLPNFSVLVRGLDDWDESRQAPIAEERLVAAIRALPGLGGVQELRSAPWEPETSNPFDSWASTGIPVSPFPRWLRCSGCNYLAPIDTGLFELRTEPYRPDRARYLHHNCSKAGKPPPAVPARFVLACSRGHIDEFPWIELVHRGGPCSGAPVLEAVDLAAGNRSTDVLVRCRTCSQQFYVGWAFRENAGAVLPRCRGRAAHIGRFETCPEQASAMLLGASNAWFAVTRRALSIPASGEPVEQLVAQHWGVLAAALTPETLEALLKHVPALRPLARHGVEAAWQAVEAHRARLAAGHGVGGTGDLAGPEWRVLSHPDGAAAGPDFKLVGVGPPEGWERWFEPTVLVERLREVTALVGFTRIDGPDAGSPVAPLAREAPRWVPAAETRGEGIFLRLREEVVAAWEVRARTSDRLARLRAAHRAWRRRRGLDETLGWPGERYVLLHTLAHALVNELALECGYAAASLRERIYSAEAGGDGPAMAGILLYTAAPDSEGTLGGLVSLGHPALLGGVLARAVERVGLCGSDPLCADHCPDESEDALHGAACHACLFVPETTCERGNRYLDRAVLCATLAGAGTGLFEEVPARTS